VLIYANSVAIEPENGPTQVIELVARWAGLGGKGFVDPARLALGIRDLRLPAGGRVLSSRATVDDEKRPTYPYLFCARLTHPQDGVPGRLLVTEIGLRQEAPGRPVECSVLLKTDEISARVMAPIQVTRPRLIQDLMTSCQPIGHTPGMSVKRLDEDSAEPFLREIERMERRHPIVVVSSTADGSRAVDPERLRSIVFGLADVVAVAPDANTFAIERVVGRRYIAFGGAINITFAPRSANSEARCETVLMRWSQLQEALQAGSSVESEVLAAITHRSNLPNSWRHISMETVAQATLRSRLTRALAQVQGKPDESGYLKLLEEAIDQISDKDLQISCLRQDLEDRSDSIERLSAANEGLKHALAGRQPADLEPAADAIAGEQPLLRDAMIAALAGDPSLEQGLKLIGVLYADRVVVLETAAQSARDSDRRGFRFGSKGLELLIKLARDYWQVLANGQGDQQAKTIFGKAFAASEAETMSTDGRRRRTFVYRDKPLVMEKHLKYGVKDSSAETLRIHFEWTAQEGRIVIGHCGKHLDL
jgi:hypothetical protein